MTAGRQKGTPGGLPASGAGFHEEDVRVAARGAGTALMGSAAGKGLLFASQIVIARLLGVEAFGLYAIGFAVVRMAEVISRAGLNTGGMRFVSIFKDRDYRGLKRVIVYSTGISFAAGALMAAAIHLLAGDIARGIFGKPELAGAIRVFALSVPFAAGMTVAAQLLQGFHTTRHTVFVRDLVQPVSNLCLVLLFYFSGLGLSGVIYAFGLSHALALLAGIHLLWKKLPGYRGRAEGVSFGVWSLLSYSAPLLFTGVLQYFLSWTDTLMLGFLGTARDAGVYRAAAQVPFMMTLFLFASNSIYSPMVANIHAAGQMQRFARLFQLTTRWVVYATVPLFIFLLFTAKDVMMVFGAEYAEAGAAVLMVLSVGQLVNCLTGGVGYTLVMTGRQKLELANSAGLLMLNVALNWALIPRYGALGAAYSSSISVAAINVARLAEVFALYGVSPYTGRVLRILLPSLACVIALTVLDGSFSSAAKLLVNMSLTAGIFLASFYFFMLGDEDRYLLEVVKGRLAGRRAE